MATAKKQNKKAATKKAATKKAAVTNYLDAFDALCKRADIVASLDVKHEECKTGARRSEAWSGKRLVVLESGQLAQPIRKNARGQVDCRSVASVPAMGKKALEAVATAWSKSGGVDSEEGAAYYGPRGITGELPSGQCMQQCFSTYSGRMVVPTVADSRYLGAFLLCMGETDGLNVAARNGAERLAKDYLAMREAMEREQTQPGTGIAYLTVSK